MNFCSISRFCAADAFSTICEMREQRLAAGVGLPLRDLREQFVEQSAPRAALTVSKSEDYVLVFIRCHGLLIGRDSQRLASASLTNCSFDRVPLQLSSQAQRDVLLLHHGLRAHRAFDRTDRLLPAADRFQQVAAMVAAADHLNLVGPDLLGGERHRVGHDAVAADEDPAFAFRR